MPFAGSEGSLRSAQGPREIHALLKDPEMKERLMQVGGIHQGIYLSGCLPEEAPWIHFAFHADHAVLVTLRDKKNLGGGGRRARRASG
jgi:hypothetical protein